ncbi:MAG TPA: glycosyltransferase family 2 protein [Chloroflexota bacterium]
MSFGAGRPPFGLSTARRRNVVWLLGLFGLAGIASYHLTRLRDDARAADALAAARRSDPASLPSQPRVTVLVAAWNEGDQIDRHIRSVRALSYPDLEYILIAGGPDGTYERAERMLGGRGILLRQEPGEGKQRALRRGWAQATGQIVYLTDADCELTDDALARLIEPIVAGGGAATGRCQPFPDEVARHPELLFQWAPEYVAQARLGSLSPGLQGGNCAVSRVALERAGGFAAEVRTGTDYHLARALAGQQIPIAFVHGSVISTEMPTSVDAYVRRQSRWLRNHWIHGRTTGDRPALLHAVRTWTIGLVVLTLPLLAPLIGAAALWAWLALVLHGSLARARYVAFLARAERIEVPPTTWLRSPLWFLVDALSWSRSLLDTLWPGRRGAW